MKKKLLSLLLAGAMMSSLAITASAEETQATAKEKEDPGVVILYTNDVHSYIDKDLTYSKVAAYKDTFEDVLLVDAGDAIQGTAYGSMDNGATVIDLMNAAGYDVATLGNHEFDYGMEGAMAAIERAEFPYVSCNFYNEKNGVPGETVLDSYKVFDFDGVKVAIVGVSTPETFTKSTPAYFQDAKGNYIYGFCEKNDGKDLYAATQKAIDAAAKEADYVIGLGHLGDDPASDPWNSEDVIANTTGFDAFIDGHSHTALVSKQVADKAGDPVVLTQTGNYFANVGQLVISDNGTISTKLVKAEDLAEVTPDAEVKAIEDKWVADVKTKLDVKIGRTNDVLTNFNGEERLVRKQETNMGDFCADALYYLFDDMNMDVDFAIMNGGGIRNNSTTGDITYLTCKDIHTFGNVACLQTVTGQQMLDALEWGAKDAAADGSKENGGFLQVSGLKYTINTAIPSTVQKDDKGVWTGGPTGEYRVKDVQVLNNKTGKYEPLDVKAEYNLAGYNYTLRNLGDGFAMFDGAVNVLDYVMEDYMVLANYVQSFQNGKVTGYGAPAGRITIVNEMPFTDVASSAAYYDAVKYCFDNKIFMGTTATTFAPASTLTRGQMVTVLWRMNGSPEPKAVSPFGDVAATSPFVKAIAWAAENELTNGTTPTTFAPGQAISRQQFLTILHRYAKFMDYDVTATADLTAFADGSGVGEYAVPAMQWAVGAGVASAIDGKLMPTDPAPRYQVAEFLANFCQKVVPADTAAAA